MVNPNSRSVNRRRFLDWIVRGIVGSIAATLAFLAGSAALRAPARRRDAGWVDGGSVDAIPPGRPLEVFLQFEREDGYRRMADRRVVYLVRTSDGVRAYSAVCTHLGCRVAWDDGAGEFRCPCHGGRFSRTGTVAAGPPPRPLDQVMVRVERGRVLLRMG